MRGKKRKDGILPLLQGMLRQGRASTSRLNRKTPTLDPSSLHASRHSFCSDTPCWSIEYQAPTKLDRLFPCWQTSGP